MKYRNIVLYQSLLYPPPFPIHCIYGYRVLISTHTCLWKPGTICSDRNSHRCVHWGRSRFPFPVYRCGQLTPDRSDCEYLFSLTTISVTVVHTHELNPLCIRQTSGRYGHPLDTAHCTRRHVPHHTSLRGFHFPVIITQLQIFSMNVLPFFL